jgi:phosphoribosylformylglycinamidine synthase subunit PurSL
MTALAQPSVARMPTGAVHRFEVRPKPSLADVRGESARAQLASVAELPPTQVDFAAVYLIEGRLSPEQARTIANDLLRDPVTQITMSGAQPAKAGSAVVEVHPLPGVTDPAAESVQAAIDALLGVEVQVRTGARYDLHGVAPADAAALVSKCLANPVIHAIHAGPYHPQSFPTARAREADVSDVPLRQLDDKALEKLSRDAHLFLSLEEMQAIQAEYRRLGREPREIELETLAQTWSEHCVHKTLKATIRYVEEGSASPRFGAGRPGHAANSDGSVTIKNLLKSTVAAATHELIAEGVDWCLSVFVDNSGVIRFDDETAVCFKVETHNHPSAIEPYGGAATGIGGCIRDVMGTGLAAKPIAATDIFCVAPLDLAEVPAGCLHPKRVLSQVVAGVRDYGNRMGIPTLNGAVWFDPDYVGNPLVYCGCVGVLPSHLVRGEAKPGDRIVAVGGRTGRDGIHGATFSSAELTDTHADEFAHAVQIGNAITEKKVLDAILAARDARGGPLFNAITDCGAGGFSSAVGEMGKDLGAAVELERAPLKYEGLTPTEIWISEAQERMVLAVPVGKLAQLGEIFEAHDVEWCELGVFGDGGDPSLTLNYRGSRIGTLGMHFLHEGVPMPTREARWSPVKRTAPAGQPRASVSSALRRLLAHPNIASKRWIIRQYDHEVQGGSVIKPLVGAAQMGPSDAAVILPKPGHRGLAIGNGLATGWKDDPYLMALAAIDECVRNLVCVGADPDRIAILDNFCWPSCRDPRNLGSLVRAAEGCYDAAKAHRTPFISGKDSLNNQFTTESGRTIQIPPTLLISGMGIVPDVRAAATMDAKEAGDLLVVVGATGRSLCGSHYELLFGSGDGELPQSDLTVAPRVARAVHRLIRDGLVRAAHDCSEGGLIVAAAEMAFAGELGLALDLAFLPREAGVDTREACFAETPGRYLLEVRRDDLSRVASGLSSLPFAVIGEFTAERRLRLAEGGVDESIGSLASVWNGMEAP